MNSLNTTPSSEIQQQRRVASERLAYSVAEAVEATGLSKTTLYGLIGQGRLRTTLVGRRRLIPASASTELACGEAA